MSIRMGGRLLYVVALLLLAFSVSGAQDETNDAAKYADSPALVTTAGTPEALCEAAGDPASPEVNQWASAEEVLEDGVDYRAIMCTDAGAIYIDLFQDQTPITVNNFVFLAYNGYYNNTIFHRVIEAFMAQGGDPTGTGAGGPGYQFADEFEPYLYFDRIGLLAMANAGPGTNGSQFFITTELTPHLDYRHTIFGEVLEGYDKVAEIKLRDPEAGGDATALKTVLVVKDPALVETTFVEAEPPTQADVEAALSPDGVIAAATALFGSFPGEEVAVDERVFDVAGAVENAPNSVKAPLESFLTANSVEFVVSSTMNSVNCALDVIPFVSISYTVYAMPSAEAAESALADANLPNLGIANGQTTVSGLAYDQPVYTGETSACDVGATAGRAFFTRGRYFVEAETVIPADSQYSAAIIIERLGSIIFDRALSGILRAGIR